MLETRISGTREPTAGGDGATDEMPATANDLLPLAATIGALIKHQRRRRFAIVSQSRCDRSCEAFIVRTLWPEPPADEAERKRRFKMAGTFRREVEKGGRVQQMGAGNGHCMTDPAALLDAVTIAAVSATARAAWDGIRADDERDMVRLARTLPAHDWVAGIRGLGDLGFAIIVAEAGNLAYYPTVETLWKRLGLAVFDGLSQRRWSDKDKALRVGYSPRRRAEIWSIADPFFRHQWAGDKDAAGRNPAKTKQPVAEPAHPTSLYGEIYAERKARLLARNETGENAARAAREVESARGRRVAPHPDNLAGRLSAAHIENDARRIMTKALIRDLWREWRWRVAAGTEAAP